MIYIKGDLHADVDINDLSSSNFPEGKHLTKKDYVIICGDFGVGFFNKYHLEWLKNKKFTTLFIRGNHDNPELLNSLEEVEMFGSKVRKFYDSIYWLQDSEIYTIENQTFFCYGGALSIDKENRKIGINWWHDEVPGYQQFYKALENLEKVNNKVDYILTHTCPHSAIENLYESLKIKTIINLEPKFKDTTCDALDYFNENIVFKKWFFGHFHEDILLDNFISTYHKIHKLLSSN